VTCDIMMVQAVKKAVPPRGSTHPMHCTGNSLTQNGSVPNRRQVYDAGNTVKWHSTCPAKLVERF